MIEDGFGTVVFVLTVAMAWWSAGQRIGLYLSSLLSSMNQIDTYTPAIVQLCVAHRVKRLYAFGSVLTDKFSKNSDVDLIVDFADVAVSDYADNYFELKFSLQSLLKRPIDLLEEKAIKNPYFRDLVVQQRQLVYEQ